MKNTFYSKINILLGCITLISTVFFSSCSTSATFLDVSVKKSTDSIIATNDKEKVLSSLRSLTDSMDAKLFLKAINTLKIPEEIILNINNNDKISLYSFERMQNEIDDIQHIIQFSLMNQLINSKYFVLDRDALPLFKTMIEKSNNFYALFYSNNNIVSLNDSTMRKMMSISKDVNIQYANKILIYKVLNCGIKKSKVSDSKTIIRYANVILQLDLIEVATSRILASKIAEGSANDEISEDLNNKLDVVHFENTNYNLPFSMGFVKPSILSFSKSESKNFSKASNVTFKFKQGNVISEAIITNSNNERVYRFNIPASISDAVRTYVFNWDLRDLNKATVPQGKYYIKIVINSTGQEVSSNEFTIDNPIEIGQIGTEVNSKKFPPQVTNETPIAPQNTIQNGVEASNKVVKIGDKVKIYLESTSSNYIGTIKEINGDILKVEFRFFGKDKIIEIKKNDVKRI